MRFQPSPVSLTIGYDNRWYRIAVEADLFGPCNLVRSWGNRRTSYQRTHVQPKPDEDSAWQLVTKIVARKLRKGYVMVEPSQDQEWLVDNNYSR